MVIVIFAVEPERQQVDTIIEFVETAVRRQPGFVSSSIHKSLDGVQDELCPVEKPVRLRSFYQQSLCAIVLPKLCEFRLLDSHVFEVVVSTRGCLKISQGGLIHLAEFRMKPENQQRLVSWKGIHNDRVAASRLNFCQFQPPDGVRTNYGNRKF